MKKGLWILFLFFSQMINAQIEFDIFFEKKTLRIDFAIGGNDSVEMVMLKQMKKEPLWGGNPKNLINVHNTGDFQYRLLDKNSGNVIFSRGFNSLFREWQTLKEAKEINRSFYHVSIMPFPKKEMVFEIQSRNKKGVFETIFTKIIDPEDYFIKTEQVDSEHVKVSVKNSSSKAIDIVFLADGYRVLEMEKFMKDVEKFKDYLLDVQPFKSNKRLFNFYAIKTPSEESGADIPGEKIHKKTAFGATFYTFNSPRYLTVPDIKKMYDVAANVPYDHIYVLINTNIYGGAGFYNHYTSCAVDNENSYEISSHELAHGLIGLADEYFYDNADEISYYYDLSVEPWEANITTLVDFENKWIKQVEKNTPIPTPRIQSYLNKTGAFEGGAYQSKGIFSPKQDCKMKSNNVKEFCPVCEKSCKKMLFFLTGKKTK